MDDQRRVELLRQMLGRLTGQPAARRPGPPAAPAPARIAPVDPVQRRLQLMRSMLDRLDR